MVDIKKMIENKKALSLLLLTLVLVSCWNNQSTSDSITNSDTQIKTQDIQQDLWDNSEDISETKENNTSTSDSSVASVDGKLNINSKCIWCGHCVRFSSTNFSMNSSTHKAEVISQENITSVAVEKAIERCPVSAISIS